MATAEERKDGFPPVDKRLAAENIEVTKKFFKCSLFLEIDGKSYFPI